MDTVFLYNLNNESFPTEVVRYFAIGENKYFIYTLNEIDENGYVQLYVSKIVTEEGKLSTKTIMDEDEWSNFKKEIEKIVVNNRNGITNSTDIDFNELNNMVVTEFKIFKLKENVAKELGLNKNAVPIKTEPQTLEAASAEQNGLTIEEILQQVSESAKMAKESIEEVKEDSNDEIEEMKPITVNNIPEINEDNEDYKTKYETLLSTVKNLEDENLKLINEVIEAKARLETIKDIIG